MLELVLLCLPDVLVREEDMGMEEDPGSYPNASISHLTKVGFLVSAEGGEESRNIFSPVISFL